MSGIIVFWSNREIKMPQNVVFRLNRRIKKLFKETTKLKCRENFLPYVKAVFHSVKIFVQADFFELKFVREKI